MSEISAGVQILITQLEENPEAFFGPVESDPYGSYGSPKFGGWIHAIENEIIKVPSSNVGIQRVLPGVWFMTEAEKAALAEAYTKARRQRFDAEIIYALNRPAEEPAKTLTVKAQGRYSTNLANTITAAKEAVSSGPFGTVVANTRS